MTQLRILSGEQIRKAVTMADVVDAMETAFIELSAERVEMPARSHIEISEPEGSALFMPSYIPSTGMIGIKTTPMFEANRTKGVPYIQGLGKSLRVGLRGEHLAMRLLYSNRSGLLFRIWLPQR